VAVGRRRQIKLPPLNRPPVRLTRPTSLPRFSLDALATPTSTQCSLVLDIHYYNSDAQGEPLTGQPHKQSFAVPVALVIEWLQQSGPDSMPGKNASGDLLVEEWQQLLGDIGNSLPGGSDLAPLASVIEPFRSGNEKAMYDVLRQIELWLVATSAELQWAVSLRLQRIYHEVFHVPSLGHLHLRPVELEAASGKTEILSEAEVVVLDPLRLELGQEVKQHRLEAIAREGVDDSGRFHKTLKTYIGAKKKLDIGVGGQIRRHQPVEVLIQAAWGHLLELTERCRQRNLAHFSAGQIRRAIITYPAVSPPSVRRDIEQLVKELGIANAQTSYGKSREQPQCLFLTLAPSFTRLIPIPWAKHAAANGERHRCKSPSCARTTRRAMNVIGLTSQATR
jgi:hypothetical protein